MSKHQKRRNSGLMYEFLVKKISTSLVAGDQPVAQRALKVLKQHFKPGTELHRESRLIRSLINTTVSSDAVAASIVREAKEAARQYDSPVLDREKSLLIRNVNHRLNDESFYDQHVDEYRMYATIQTLLNDWRSTDPNIVRVAKYEDELVNWLKSEKKRRTESFLNEHSPGTNRVLVKVMTKKLNEKYSSVLSPVQNDILRSYALSTSRGDVDIMVKKFTGIRDTLLRSIDEYVSTAPSVVVDKLLEVRSGIAAEALASVDDDTVTRFMLYVKLNEELLSEDSNG